MATDRRDVELVARVKDLTKQPFQEIAKAVDALIAKLAEQASAAQQGRAPLQELQQDAIRLQQAFQGLTAQQGVVENFKALNAELDQTRARATTARAAADDYRSSVGDVSNATKEQRAELKRLESDATGAERAIERLVKRVDAQSQKLQRLGIDATDVASAEAKIAGAARNTGEALTFVEAQVEQYTASIRALKQAEAEQAAQAKNKFAADAAAAQKLVEAKQYVDFWRDALEQKEIAEKRAAAAEQEYLMAVAVGPVRGILQEKARLVREAAEAQIKAAADEKAVLAASIAPARGVLAEKRRIAQEEAQVLADSVANARLVAAERQRLVREALNAAKEADAAQKDQLAGALAPTRFILAAKEAENAAIRQRDAFRKLADTLQEVSNTTSTASSTLRLAGSMQSAADAVRGIVDPARQASLTIDGLQDRIRQLSASATGIKGPVKDYELTLRQIADAERSLVQQSELVDKLRRQIAVVDAAEAEFKTAKTALDNYSTAVRNAAAPNEALAREANRAKQAFAEAAREVREQKARLDELRATAAATGINLRQLDDAQKRLVASAEQARGATQRLNAAYQQFGKSTEGGGLFGLSPYALTNLGYQINDIFTQLASGTSLVQTLGQQGGQILQVFPGAFGAIISRLPLIVALGTPVILTFAAINKELDNLAARRSFDSVLRANADGARYQTQAFLAARSELKRFGADSEEAEKALRSFLQNGIRQDRLREFGRAAQDMAKVFGIELPDAAKRVSEGFTSNFEAIVKLNNEFGFLTGETAKAVRELFEAGRTAEAQTLAFEAFRAKMKEGADLARGPWSQAMLAARNAWNDLLNYLANTAPIQLAIRALNAVANAVKGISEAISAALREAPADQQLAQAEASLAQGRERLAAAERDRNGLQRREAEKQIAEAEAAIGRLRTAQGAAPGAATPPPGVTTDDSEQQRVRGEQFAAQQRRELEAGRQLNAEQRVRRAGEDALNRAIEARLSLTDQQAAKARAEAAERGKIAEEERNFLANLREQGQARSYNNAQQRIQAAGERAARQAEERQLSATAQAEAKAIAEQNERNKIAQENARAGGAALNQEREILNQLSALRATANAQEKTQLDQRLAAIDERYERLFRTIEAFERRGGRTIGGRPTSEIRAEVEAQKERLKNTETLKFYEDSVNTVVRERQELFQQIRDELAAGTITAAEGYRQAEEANARTAEQIRTLADEAKRFAENLRRAGTPDPRLELFIARMGRALTQNAERGTPRSALGGFAREEIARQEQEINRVIQERTQAVQSFNQLAELGLITLADAQEKTRQAFEGTRPELVRLTAEMLAFAEAARASGSITQTQFDAINARVQNLRAQAQYLDPLLASIKGSISDAFGNEFLRGLSDAAGLLAEVLNGTKSWSDALEEAGNIALNFIASLLKGIGEAILKFYILQAVSAAMKALGLGAEVAETGAEAAGAAATTAAAASLGTAGAAVGAGGAVVQGAATTLGAAAGILQGAGGTIVGAAAGLSSAAAATAAAAQLLIIANAARAATGGVAHEGGIVGSLMRSRPVNPWWFAGAPRYHGGGIAGLQPNEMPAIVERGEEILTRDDPRHAMNAGKGEGGGAGPSQLAIRNVLVLDPEHVPSAMKGARGEKVTIGHIQKNAPAIRQILGL